MKTRILLLISILIVTGCKSAPRDAVVSGDIPFIDREDKISKPIGLYISEKSRNYIAKQFKRKDAGMSKSGVYFSIDFGKNLEANSVKSLSKIFQRVIPVNEKKFSGKGYSYLIQIEIDERTKFDIGNFTFSKKYAYVFMNCTLYNISGKVLWNETINSEASRHNLKGLLGSSPLFYTSARVAAINKLQAAAEQSVGANLEMLNTRMLENKSLFR